MRREEQPLYAGRQLAYEEGLIANKKPVTQTGFVSRSAVRLRFASAAQSETREAQAEQCESGGFRHGLPGSRRRSAPGGRPCRREALAAGARPVRSPKAEAPARPRRESARCDRDGIPAGIHLDGHFIFTATKWPSLSLAPVAMYKVRSAEIASMPGFG